MIHLVMPMGGAGSRFSVDGGPGRPKPLLQIWGRPFFYWATQAICKFVQLKTLTFVVLRQHIEEHGLDSVIKSYYPEANLVVLDQVLNGAVLTCMEGVRSITDETAPIVFNDCDHIFKAKLFYDYCRCGVFRDEGALLTFESTEPKYSFLETDTNGYVRRTVEKEVISNLAICGAYFFKSKRIFQLAAEEYLQSCAYTEYYLSGVYNVMAANGNKIRFFPVEWHCSFGTPDEYQAALKSDYFEELI